ncbi:SDR family NAD(P)-dependent oxidoreductase [Nocardia jiangxiensis]|uniref:SDR family NAD(P)-dependent oxidoreductase n=1 Tax=Nocardia jiangxiensis TaxID=282685 RepID=A0ABW6SC87_9NOCA|nr:SDR family NAD(P)-dependent oxidoreductase [Nocardia jiangxiensis]
MLLEGRRIIVTGGAQGMGAALVNAYAEVGAKVGYVDVQDRSEHAGTPAGVKVTGLAKFARCDVTDKNSVTTAFGELAQELGGLDVLVHLAGIMLHAKAEDITPDDWQRQMTVNTLGTLLTNQVAFTLLKEHGGAIINFASGAGVRGFPGGGHYAASKAAVLGWSRSAAMEWGPYGITVNAICPGIDTPMAAAHRAGMTPEQRARTEQRLREVTPIDGKLGDADRDLAPYLIYLASPGARFITGQTLAVDGGRTMMR